MALRRLEQKQISLIKLLTYALGVRPDEFGLVPDPLGWVGLKELVKAVNEEPDWRFVRETSVVEAATRLAPEALELDADGRRVRALERRDPERDYAADPPPHLYYGARRRAWPVIKERGLNAPEGGVLVLVADPEYALRLGRRRDAEPVLVTVQARLAGERGAYFSLFGDKLWLCDWVPAECLMGPPIPEKLPEKKPQKPAPPPQPAWAPIAPTAESMPGSYLVTAEDMAVKPYKRKGLKKEIDWKNERRKDSRRREKE